MSLAKLIKFHIIFICIILLHQQLNDFSVVAMTIKFTNLICKSYDTAFLEFKKCQLKAMARDKISASVYVSLYQTPIDNITVNAALFVKSSSQRYHPYLYNQTIDFCKFMKNQNSFPFWKIILSRVIPYSNFNHSCPYDNDMFLDNFILDPSMIKIVPFPTGEYLIAIRAGAYNVYRGEARWYIQIKE